MTVDVPVDRDVYCPGCGYNVRGVESGRCPECGSAFDASTLTNSTLPWACRREVGDVRAYWKTAVAATFRHHHFLQQVGGLVSLSDARRFWLTTVSLAYTPVVLLMLWLHWINDRQPIFVTVISLLSVLAWMIVMSGAPGYLCHSRKRSIKEQNRAIAVSYYGCAPLAWTPVVFAVVVGLVALANTTTSFIGIVALSIPVVMLSICLPVAWFMDTVKLIRHTTNAGFTTNVKLMGIWIVVTLALLVVLPSMLAFLYVFVLSYFHLV